MKYQINGRKSKKHVAIHSIGLILKNFFIKDFEFIPEEEHLKEMTQQIKSFQENQHQLDKKKKGR
jgi:hypothetical protein